MAKRLETPQQAERRRAQQRVRWAVYHGKLKKPTACERCHKETERLQAHHDDYSKPLDVMWLCWTGAAPCHPIADGKRALREQA